MGKGSSDYQGDPRLGQVGRPNIYWASPRGQLSSHVGLCNECALDSQWQGCEVGDYVMMGVFMVAITGFWYERDGPGTKCQPVRCGWNTTGQVPKLCVGGGNQSGKYAIVEICCAELKSCSMHVLSCCSWCCHYTTTTPLGKTSLNDTKASLWLDNTIKRTETHNKKKRRKLQGCNRCPGGIELTETYRAETVERPKILQNIGDWLWKLIHNRLRSGAYWKNVPSYEERACCEYFQNLETMDHILFSCTIEGREKIWEMAEKLYELPMKENNRLNWTVPSEAPLRRLSSLKLRNTNEKL